MQIPAVSGAGMGATTFTQEQLNAQVVSLESVVRNLTTENHLLNKGIKNLVEQVQSEKRKYDELSEQYNSENAEAEVEFKNLELEMEENKYFWMKNHVEKKSYFFLKKNLKNFFF